MRKFAAALVLSALSLSACTTQVESNPSRTATEEMLISTAADRAAVKLALLVPANATVFIDSTNFEGTDGKYAIASIRSHLLERGLHLLDDRKKADIIVETRSGALSTDRKSFMVGIPQFNVPVPFASSPLPFPEIALYGKEDQKAVAKFAVTAYAVKNGALVDAQEPQYGFSHKTKKTVLLFFSWTDSDYIPENADKESEGDHSAAPRSKAHVEMNKDGYAPPIGMSAPPSPTTTPPASKP